MRRGRRRAPPRGRRARRRSTGWRCRRRRGSSTQLPRGAVQTPRQRADPGWSNGSGCRGRGRRGVVDGVAVVVAAAAGRARPSTSRSSRSIRYECSASVVGRGDQQRRPRPPAATAVTTSRDGERGERASAPASRRPASARSPRRAWCGSSARGRRRSSCAGRRCRARRRWPGRRSRSSRPGRGSAPCDSTRRGLRIRKRSSSNSVAVRRISSPAAAYLVAVLVQLEVADGQHRRDSRAGARRRAASARAAGRRPPRARTAW